MDSLITLCYSRQAGMEKGEYVHRGTIVVQQGDTVSSSPFMDLVYKKMMTRLSNVMNGYPDMPVKLERLDIPGFSQMLSDKERLTLRTDPTAFINATTIPPITVVVRDKASTVPPRLLAGYDTLAGAFGEKVYLRRRDQGGVDQVEGPISGRWKKLTVVANSFGSFVDDGIEISGEFRPLSCTPERTPWLVVRVDDLLATGASRFYLPREWNYPGWITRQDLKKKLEDFLREKAEAERSMQ